MKKSLFQLYINGCEDAVPFYEKAFDAVAGNMYRDPSDNSILHCELKFLGQVIALSERTGETCCGNTMQLCFQLGGDEVLIKKIYETLKKDADIHFPLGKCVFSPLMFGLVDKFGVNWCFFI